MPCRSRSAWLVAALALGCGGNEFQGGGGSSGSATGGSGVGGMGGAAGMMTGGSSGAAGSGPTGGTAGAPACMCQPTEYCRGGDCLQCGVLSTLDFGEPVLMLDDPASSLRFPRAGDGAGSLFYRSGDEGSARLFFTGNAAALGSLVGDPGAAQQSGPLLIDLARGFNLIFDESNPGSRSARSASWDGAAISAEGDMPSPLGPSNFDDYSVAATSMGRVYWMSTRDGARLRTGNIGTGEGDVVNIDVPKRMGSGTCARDGADATPWVSPDGRRMFFRAFALDENCQPIENATTDLFVVPLDATSGMPGQAAVALASLNEVGSNETDPSLSADFCTLYFASDRDSPGSSHFKLYRAPRR